MIAEHIIEAVRANTDLVALVGKDVALKRRAGAFWGLCPFHTEKTGSFKVDPVRRFYYCFGCGASGDAVRWMIEQKGYKFADAVKALAADLGIPFEECASVLPPKRFKQLSVESKEVDTKKAWIDREKSIQMLREELDFDDSPFVRFFQGKRISDHCVRQMLDARMVGKWGGGLAYFYTNGAIKLRPDLATSHSSYWALGKPEEPWHSLYWPTGPLYLTEGETDMMRLISLGFRLGQLAAIPCASWTPTAEMAFKMAGFGSAVLCFDGDKAGRKATETIGKILKDEATCGEIYTLQMPDGKDLCKCDDDLLRDLLDNKVRL